MNSPYLGGAERSIVFQSILAKQYTLSRFIIPSLSQNDYLELEEFIRSVIPNIKIEVINYPSRLFSVSRSSGLLAMVFGLLQLPVFLVKLKKLVKSSDVLWCNGNKIGLPLYLSGRLFSRKEKLIWHFRDYPSQNRIYRKIWSMFGDEDFSLCLIGNSVDVHNKIKETVACPNVVQTVYNPVGKSFKKRSIKQIKVLGSMSMLAPWKGVHEIILLSKIFERELIDLGIERINIYGDQIYQTDGDHSNYPKDIKELAQDSKLIHFLGKRSAEEIFNSIDLLIHSSIKKEPFGRIITEAFSANIPVISTGLGGAGELVIHKETGMVYNPCHFYELFSCVKSLVTNNNLLDKVILQAELKKNEVEKLAREQILKI